MARQTSRQKLPPLAVQYYERYVRFSEQLHNAWMYFEVQLEILQLVEQRCEDEEYRAQIRVSSISPINSETRAPSRLRGSNLPGFIIRTHRKEIPETVLLNSVSLFEAFISDIAKLAYLSDPNRFLIKNKNTENETVSNQENAKLLNILVESSSREEAIEQYVEEKLRGIFYGNPVDVFKKNKLGFGLDKRIGGNLTAELEIYAEIVARRNIIVHNLGKIDRKYIREVKDTTFSVGQIVNIDREYLFRSLHLINDLAKEYVLAVSLSTTGKGLPSIRMGGKKATKSHYQI